MRTIRKRRSGPTYVHDYGPGVHWMVKIIWNDIIAGDLSTEHLTKVSGVSRSIIRRWRNGRNAPRIENVEAVLNALGYELKVIKKVEAE